MQKELPPVMISSQITSLKTDDAVKKFIKSSSLNKDRVTLIEFGASWCSHCHEIFPQFYRLTKQVIFLFLAKFKFKCYNNSIQIVIMQLHNWTICRKQEK